MATVIMIFYYAICVFVFCLLGWNFIKEKKSLNDILLYLVVMIPLALRLLRVK